MKAGYLKAPFQFELRDVSLRELKKGEVLVRVKACGFCGHDAILARYAAEDWEPFGHEFSGVGYSDVQYFTKIFKTVTGDIPTHYRNRLK